MDPTDLRAELAEQLANSKAIDAETFNAVCFLLTRALDGLELNVPDAAPLVRRTGWTGKDSPEWPSSGSTRRCARWATRRGPARSVDQSRRGRRRRVVRIEVHTDLGAARDGG